MQRIVENPTHRRWLILASIGFALVLLAMVIVFLVVVAKTQFGSLVGPAFLPAITGTVLFGGAAMMLAVLMLPNRKSWRSIVVVVWSLIALTSPLFGIMFLLPWGVLLASSPVVFAVLLRWFRVA